ncbi:NADH dehydrogenase [ubiquinone] 1 beta subcomplex subunit 5, mitochondrial [Prorops nasuta]|uniref:NADH dehydrogenase [ubiquinone] 1 beta subcomplex subunit 5, mitochondrial n=1 Tax=Prorops nasuta TaxID=863751 RepID=UPI0034CD320E
MTVFSCLLGPLTPKISAFARSLPISAIKTGAVTQKRCMSGGPRAMVVKSTEWQYTKSKDLLHFYSMLGLIPVGITILLTNIFIGPAQLQPIPEGYEPKEYEYYKNPITRFFVRWFSQSEQFYYEYDAHRHEVERIYTRLDALRKSAKYVSQDGIEPIRYYQPHNFSSATNQTLDQMYFKEDEQVLKTTLFDNLEKPGDKTNEEE